MDSLINFFRKLFDPEGFPPRWLCGDGWDAFTGWFYIVSDLMIWSAYFAIPLIIIRYITRRRDARFTRIYFLFASFILACGTTHLIDAILFWHPVYRLSALVRFITGLVSWITVFFLFRFLPLAFSLKSAKELETEVSQRKSAEEQLKVQNEMLQEAQQIARMGYWQWEVLSGQITWSENLYRIYGMEPFSEVLDFERYIGSLHPDDRQFVRDTIAQALEEKKLEAFYHRIVLPGGEVRNIHTKGKVLVNEAGDIVRMVGTAQDVTEQKKVEQELLSKSQELEATNAELQKFASIASHDLREPLRKILTFTTMLQKELPPEPARAQIYTGKIVSSASRMQQLIDDILDFSTLAAGDILFEQVNLNQVVDQVLSDMEVNITVANALVNVSKLPTVEGNPSQLGQLFQNLLSNAIKFHREGVYPVVSIHAELVYGSQLGTPQGSLPSFSVLNSPRFPAREQFCRIYVQDNGIGFDEVYADRIFNIFQRLHGRTDYDGTGIGLAICKKVVDIHHGFITARSKPGEGATFVITLPVSQRSFRGG